MDDENNERAQAAAIVGCLNQQLAYQQACRQETHYQEILAQELVLQEPHADCQTEEAVECQTEEAAECQTEEAAEFQTGEAAECQTEAAAECQTEEAARSSSADEVLNEASAVAAGDRRSGSFSRSTSHSPYITPPDSPSKLSFASPFTITTSKETQTVACEAVPLPTSVADTQTDEPPYQVNEGCQSVPLTLEVGIGTPPVCVEDKSSCTELSAFELLQVVHDAENSQRIHEEHKLAMRELNEEKSKRLVSEQLVNIVQSDLMEARQQNISETTARLRLEKEVADLKVELDCSEKKLHDKEARVHELEESLAGTMHMVQKLEQQSAVLNKGGIDYLLLSKISEGKALEAEQRLKVFQTELLHSQSEVQRLLARVEDLSRDNHEMVSSKVHNQLLRLADERADRAERKLKEVETEFMRYKEQHGKPNTSYDPSSSLTSYPSSYPTFSSAFTTSSYPSSSPSSYMSPFTLSWDKPTPSSSYSSNTSSFSPLVNKPPPTGAFSYRSGLPHSDVSITSHQLMKNSSIEETDSSSIPLSLPIVVQAKPEAVVTKSIETVIKPATGDVESDSSDWSSSDEEGEGGVPRPSAHMSLQAKWEWLSQQENPSASSDHIQPSRRPGPPPVAPKPKFLKSTTHDVIAMEAPVTFEELPKQPSLAHFNLSRPHGPRGRRLPTRSALFHHNMQLPQLVS